VAPVAFVTIEHYEVGPAPTKSPQAPDVSRSRDADWTAPSGLLASVTTLMASLSEEIWQQPALPRGAIC
jgi:hypothetical protein